MDAKIKKVCPNCNQFYYIKSILSPKITNLPLFLTCGHSMCESCLRNIIKFEEPIECKVCHRDTKLEQSDAALISQSNQKLYQFFPVNLSMVGELAMQLLEQKESEVDEGKKFFIDLQAILSSTDGKKGTCMECQKQTCKMCQQCGIVLCDACFNKSHKNFIIFKAHVLVNIDQVTTTLSITCKVHNGKPLDYYCQDCKKAVCMDCLVVGGDKSCKNHNVVSMQEVNEHFIEEITEISPKVDETLKRFTKTAVDIGHLLLNIESETGSCSELTNMLADVKQHFSKLYASIQKHEQEVVNTIVKLKHSEKESLLKAKQDLEVAIKKASRVLISINATSNPEKIKQTNLSVLLDDAKQVLNIPWYLAKDESNDPLKVAVNDDLCSLVSDYIHLEGNANSVYKLRATSEIAEGIEIPPAPSALVFPPELPKDVRKLNTIEKKVNKNQEPVLCKRVPGYRAKSGSVSSLNSGHSDTSDRFNFGNLYGDNQVYQRPAVQQVQPFAESQHPKQLHEGSQELIYITHIVDPHNFFVQRACHQGLVKEMLREFRNAGSLPKPSRNHIGEGKIYLMFNKTDNMWQRCRVVSINRKDPDKPTCHVFCIDFGSTEIVGVDKLRLLPPARVHSPYPLATNCSLANCMPKAGGWSSDDSYLIQNIVDNKQAIIHVHAIRSTSNYSVTLEVDVVTFDEGVSIAHALVFHERAKIINNRLPIPFISSATEKPKIFMSNNDLKPKSVEDVYITHIISPDKFYVRKNHLMNVFEKLCDDLDQEYNLSTNIGLVYLPGKGMSYVAYIEQRSESGPGWARAIVQELPGRSRVSIFLPDIGETVLVHWKKLRQIHPKFATSRALATECHLAGVTPLHKKWNSGSVALLQRHMGKPLQLKVEDIRRGSAGVTVYDNQDPDNVICLNEEMIKNKYAVNFGLLMFDRNSDLKNQVHTTKIPIETAKPGVSKPLKKIQIMQKSKPVDEKQLEAKDKGPLRLEAKLLYYQSPAVLYVSLVHQQKAFNELYDCIQKYYAENATTGKTVWEVGERCCIEECESWRRARVMSVNGDTATIFQSDFAVVESVPIASLRPLPPQLSSVGDAAVRCHLAGVVPADGNDDWPTITKEYLKELLDAYPRIFITKLGDFKDKSMPIEIWVYHTIQGDALEPNESEWRCLNRKIIEQGLGIPDKTQALFTDATDSKDDMLSFLKNVTGSVDEWLQLEPLPTRPLSTNLDKSFNSDTAVDDIDEASTDKISLDTMFITDWLPPEPLPSKEFTGMPTYIDNDGVIYLHDIIQSDTLALIRNALDVRFKAPDPKAKYAKWSVGEPCIAMFFLDNKFYRGRVLEVNKESSTCLIHYIDYGNEELCSFENLRKSTALHEINIQAHKCVLGRIRPVDTRWDRTALDYIHKLIVEKQCLIKVLGDPVGDLIPIDLKYDKLWLNDHLVDFEMAKYTDGSRAVVRKYAAVAPSPELEPLDADTDDADTSGPDYIVLDDIAPDADADDVLSATASSLQGKDWNELIEAEERETHAGRFVEYPPLEQDEFRCTVNVVVDAVTLELGVQPDGAGAAAERRSRIQEELQLCGDELAALCGTYERKACAARYPSDSRWYRAELLEYSADLAKAKVRFVDYGDVDVLDVADVRELPAGAAGVAPGSLRVRVAGVTVNPSAGTPDLAAAAAAAYADRGVLRCRVVSRRTPLPLVEITDEEGAAPHDALLRANLLMPFDDQHLR